MLHLGCNKRLKFGKFLFDTFDSVFYEAFVWGSDKEKEKEKFVDDSLKAHFFPVSLKFITLEPYKK